MVAEPLNRGVRPCPAELAHYLETSHHCIHGTTIPKIFFVNLQSFMDTQCSGLGTCQMWVGKPAEPKYSIRPCPLELMTYLTASYTCTNGIYFSTMSS